MHHLFNNSGRGDKHATCIVVGNSRLMYHHVFTLPLSVSSYMRGAAIQRFAILVALIGGVLHLSGVIQGNLWGPRPGYGMGDYLAFCAHWCCRCSNRSSSGDSQRVSPSIWYPIIIRYARSTFQLLHHSISERTWNSPTQWSGVTRMNRTISLTIIMCRVEQPSPEHICRFLTSSDGIRG
jgi:hypothetical protein